MQKFHPAVLLLAAALLQPAAVSAEEEQICPPCNATLYYSVGTAIIHLDRSCIGGTLFIRRDIQEGNYTYYEYSPSLIEEAVLYCPLIEGEYELEITLPSDRMQSSDDPASTDARTDSYTLSFMIQDPDMDPTQSFAHTVAEFWITNDTELMNDLYSAEEPVLEDTTIHEVQRLTMARRNFQAGDVERNGSLEPADASAILNYIAVTGSGEKSKLTPMQEAEADLNRNGVVDTADASLILVYITECAANGYSGDIIRYIKENQR